MSSDIISIVNSIPDRQPANLTVTDGDGARRQYPCVFKESNAPEFFLLFAPGTMPQGFNEDWRYALISKDDDDQTVTLSAKLVAHPNNRVLEMVAKKSIRPEDLREYFRVKIKTSMAVYYDPAEDDPIESLALNGETVDISQTGVLTILPEECTITRPVILEINLPNPTETIICTGSVVRTKRITRSRWLTSFHFERISTRSRDVIAKNCFAEQRRQLRENIQTST